MYEKMIKLIITKKMQIKSEVFFLIHLFILQQLDTLVCAVRHTNVDKTSVIFAGPKLRSQSSPVQDTRAISHTWLFKFKTREIK